MNRPTAERFGSPLVTSQLHSGFTQRASELERESETQRERERKRERDIYIYIYIHTYIYIYTHTHTHIYGRERERERERETATAWPLSSKHPYTTDSWRGKGNRELRLFVAKQRMTQHWIVRRCTNSSQGLERYSHIAVGRLLQPFAQTLASLAEPPGHYTDHQFNIQQFYFLPTQCICVFCVDLRTAIIWNCSRI